MTTPTTAAIETVLAKLSTTSRTRLADLKADADLIRYMAANEYIALFHMDNGREMVDADRAAAVTYGGSLNHIAYKL